MRIRLSIVASLLWLPFPLLWGAVPFERVVIDDKAPESPWAKILGDINGDSLPDILIGGRRGPLVWYRNPDWHRAVISAGGYRTVDGEVGDIDGDGDLDVVMGGVVWYENPRPERDPGSGPWKAHDVADHPTHDVELSDLDRDGDLDIVTRDQSDFGHKAGNKIYLWKQTGNSPWTRKVIDCPHGEGLALHDLDRDGDDDIVIGGIWFENPGSISDDPWHRHTFAEWHPSAAVQVADLNGDGRWDVVLSPSELKDQYHRLSWFEGPSDPKQSNWAEHVIEPRIECVIHGIEIADMNLDGRVDVVTAAMHQGQDPDEVAVYYNQRDGTHWEKQILSTKGSHLIRVADIDGDGDPDVMGANHGGPYAPVEVWKNKSADQLNDLGWWHPTYRQRVLIIVDAAGTQRRDLPVEVSINFRANTFRVLEIDPAKKVYRDELPCQFESTDSGGTLVFLLEGVTPGDGLRVYHAYFDPIGVESETSTAASQITVTDHVQYQGQESFKIESQNAVYYYHKQGAGFASLLDDEGHDWLSYHPGVGPVSNSGSGGKYRGIPNMGHPEGYCHPGSTKSHSRLVNRGPLMVSIESQSEDGQWATRWDIFPRHARLTVIKASHPYWLLYEGTPGGRLDLESDFCVRADASEGTRTPANVRWDGDISTPGPGGEWLYFGESSTGRVLYLINHQDDDAIDSYWPMNEEMTVFGFGRQGINKYMTRAPARFTIGFANQSDFDTVSGVVHALDRPLQIFTGSPQTKGSPKKTGVPK